MKILIVTAVFPPEPVVSAQISTDLSIELLKRGHQVTVLAPYPSRPNGFNFADFDIKNTEKYYKNKLGNINVLHVKSFTSPKPSFLGRLRENYSFGKACSKIISASFADYDRIYINSWPLFSQYLVAKAAIKLKISYYVHVQDIYPESLENKLPPFARKMVKKMLMPLELYHLKHATRIIAISDKMKSHLCSTRNISEEKIDIVYNWQDEEKFDGPFIKHAEKFTFMYLGNIGPVAGVENLINAFGQSGLNSCRLVIAGSGANRQNCVKTSESYPLADVGFVDVPEGCVPGTQYNADVLLLPMKKGTAQTSIPSKLPAYMFSAKPVIAAVDRDSDTANAILAAGCGWIIPPESIENLSDTFKKVNLLDSGLLKKMGDSGRTYALENFSKKINLKRLVEILEK
jgi:glycosyltransferase involved in cell wall biosynthesis